MRLNDDTVLDDAIQLLEEHSWRTSMPCLDREHVAELVAVLTPLFQRSRPKVAARKRERQPQKLPSRPVRVSSSEIPEDIRNAVLERDRYSCARCDRYLVDTIRYGLQHRRPRGRGGSRLLHTMANLVTLCGWSVDAGTCTEWVEVIDRVEATRQGWLVPHGVAPEKWPVELAPNRWEQPGDIWTPAKPHQRQIEMGSAA